ncbi:branched-chain amino acid aminotransferase [Streptomyces sp. 8N616]|uniref:branched-chain amino acid aminotransferase n=1 Tax=Streptomyces sp. 8N616 TaxID=3457414 RepID=UPI003FD0C0CD
MTAKQRRARMSRPGFGSVFTEHMVSIQYADGRWRDEQVMPYGPVPFDPATAALHYAQSIFEGLRVFRARDGGVHAFRPDAHARRFRESARRLMMPELPEDLFVAAVEELVRCDEPWIPEDLGITLYLRPVMFATEPFIGLRPARTYRFLLIACVAEALLGNDTGALSVWVSEGYSRAATGGTGAAKYAGNYAAAYRAQAEAEENGCDQVVWLDSASRSWVEEMSAMNLFFVFGRESQARLVTPPLTGTLLAGVTRDCLMTLAGDLGLPAVQRPVSFTDWRDGARDGRITETFACGTAARISPIGRVRSPKGSWLIGNGGSGPVTRELEARLSAVQNGLVPDTYGWLHRIA